MELGAYHDRAAITLVDNDSESLALLAAAADDLGYAHQSARSPEAAFELLQNQLTPLVIADLCLPGPGTEWLVREIRGRCAKTIVIVVSAGQDADPLLRCLDAGASRYFFKPIHLLEMRLACEAGLRDLRANQRTNRRHRALEDEKRSQKKPHRGVFNSAIGSLVRTLEARDPYTSGHSLRVKDLALRLAEHVGLDRRSCTRVCLAGMLHDIGKVGLPEGILNKPGPLTEEELRAVHQHPIIGESILRPLVRSRQIRLAIRGHHERFDGGGYPDGLSGEGIPLAARIIAIADCFDSLTSSRAYRAARSYAEAIQIVRDGAGSQFDPRLAFAFLESLESTAGAGKTASGPNLVNFHRKDRLRTSPLRV